MKHIHFIIASFLFLFSGLVYSQDFPSRGEVYDYDIGDIFHIRESGSAPGSGYYALVNIDILDKYYSNNGDTVFYIQLNKRIEESSINPIPIYTEIEETIFYTNLNEIVLTDSILEDLDFYNGRITVFHFDSNNSDTFFKDRYTIGCGHSYHQYMSTDPENLVDFELQLVYFKKGDEEWGNEHVITGTPELSKNKHLTIYPNPSENYLNIIVNDAVSNSLIQVFNVTGKLLLSKELNSNTNRINVSAFPNGFYYIQHVDGAGHIITKSKFLKI